jgi:hypothetical protein
VGELQFDRDCRRGGVQGLHQTRGGAAEAVPLVIVGQLHNFSPMISVNRGSARRHRQRWLVIGPRYGTLNPNHHVLFPVKGLIMFGLRRGAPCEANSGHPPAGVGAARLYTGGRKTTV